jgi:polyhydroxybutyrate depolymerase
MSGKEPVPSQPVSVIAFNGTDDRVVPYNGSSGGANDFKPVSFAVDFWAKANSTGKEAKKEETAQFIKEVYSGGKNQTEVIQYTIKGGGHVWYGRLARFGQGDNSGIEATDLIWEFFKAHPKQ